jgi:uncharacterized membrane protein
MTEQTNYDNRSLNGAVARALMVGVILSLALMVVGIILAVLQPDRLFDQVLPLNALPTALMEGSPMAFFGLGILALLVTPPLRELALLICYARQGRWLFVIIAVIVLIILGLSVYLSLTR